MSNFGYNRESVAWVEGYIERYRSGTDLNAEVTEGLISVIGSFLGECIIHCYGGTWERDGKYGIWGVSFNESNAAFPFSKVRKQIENGIDAGDSILSFFNSIGLLFAQEKKRKPWWRFW